MRIANRESRIPQNQNVEIRKPKSCRAAPWRQEFRFRQFDARFSTTRDPQSASRKPQDQHAFTLVELLIVIVVVGILFGLSIPKLAESRDLKLQQAARMLAADIEFAETDSIAHPDTPRIIKFNTTNSTWWIGTLGTPDTPITDPVRGGSYLVSFGSGRRAGLSGMTIQSVSLGGDSELHFDAYGVPDQSTNAAITLACSGATMTLQVDAGTGEVTVP